MAIIDLNCDLGEGMGDDDAILPFVTSANVACGLHAGGPAVMRRTVDEAARRGVAIGAHPGYADREHFGRRELPLAPDEIYDLVAYQLGALAAFTRRAGVPLAHVKPHGALYHVAARDADAAQAMVAATRAAGVDIVVGPPGSRLEAAARGAGLRFAAEGFADRGYGDDGRLVPRGHPQALVAGGDGEVAARAVAIVREQRVPTVAGASLPLAAQTLCLHGDDARAAGRAAAIRRALEQAGVTVSPLPSWLV